MTGERPRRSRLTLLGLGFLTTLSLISLAGAGSLISSAGASVKPRVVIVLPFDASPLAADERWLGDGVAEVVTLGLAQHPAFVQIERARLRTLGEPEAWGETVVLQAVRAIHADAAVFGRITRKDADM